MHSYFSHCDHYSSTSSILNHLTHSFSSLCPFYKSFTGYMCVRNSWKDFYGSCIQVLSFYGIFDLIFSILSVLSDSFSRVCTSYSRFNCFMCARIQLKQVWTTCIHILVILSPLLVFFINVETFKPFFPQFVPIL